MFGFVLVALGDAEGALLHRSRRLIEGMTGPVDVRLGEVEVGHFAELGDVEDDEGGGGDEEDEVEDFLRHSWFESQKRLIQN